MNYSALTLRCTSKLIPSDGRRCLPMHVGRPNPSGRNVHPSFHDGPGRVHCPSPAMTARYIRFRLAPRTWSLLFRF